VVAGVREGEAEVDGDGMWDKLKRGENSHETLARQNLRRECHGSGLTGDSRAAGGESPSPSLAAAAEYTPEQFVTLMSTGTSRDPARQLGVMGETAARSLKYLTDEEVAAIYRYLKALPLSGVADR
jgi:hypothetical protein